MVIVVVGDWICNRSLTTSTGTKRMQLDARNQNRVCNEGELMRQKKKMKMRGMLLWRMHTGG